MALLLWLAELNHAYAQSAGDQKYLATQLDNDLKEISRSIFDIKAIEKLSKTKLIPTTHDPAIPEERYRSENTLRAPYSEIEYQRRSDQNWAELKLKIDKRHCISSRDLNDFFPMGIGEPRTTDHPTDKEFEIGFGDEKRKIWIVYEIGTSIDCAREFKMEANR